MLRAPLVALLVLLTAAFALRSQAAPIEHHHLSADEQAYGRLALDIVNRGQYGDPAMLAPTRWAPGAPVAFAAAHALLPGPAPRRPYEVPEARTLNVLLGTGAVLAAFGAAAVIAGPWAGVAAAAAVTAYPPLIFVTKFQLSEPLGACLLAAAVWALAVAARRRSLLWLAAGGALLGATVLARADLLPVVPVLTLLAAWLARRAGALAALASGGALLAGALVLIVPWSAFVSLYRHHVVPVSDGGPGTLFIGTYLPGNGTLYGFKHRWTRVVRAQRPRYRRLPVRRIPAGAMLSAVARRYGDGDRNRALTRASLDNLRRYALGAPLAFARLTAGKVTRLWLRPFRYHGAWIALHLAFLAAALAGLAVGLLRRRDPVLLAVAATVLVSTAVNALLVAEPRHNLPLLPALFAAGGAGWALGRSPARAGRQGAAGSAPSAAPADRDASPQRPAAAARAARR